MKLSTHLRALLAGAAMTGLCFSALAQTTTTTTTAPMGSMQAPAAVGVTPQAAAEANRNAVPRSDTGTVVRTGPNAMDASRAAASAASGSNTSMSGTSGTRRPARADRN